jgi:hypothetical protein
MSINSLIFFREFADIFEHEVCLVITENNNLTFRRYLIRGKSNFANLRKNMKLFLDIHHIDS